MEEIIKTSDNLQESEHKEVLYRIDDMESYLAFHEPQVDLANYTPLPISRLASYGIAFQPLVSAVQTAVTGAGGSGLYYVDTGGKTMFQMKGTHKRIGALQKSDGSVGGGQAQLTQLACDPTMLFMAAAMANIDKKLDTIKEMQQEMIDFLVQKEKSELKGSLNFLYDVFNNYRYNWNNAMYKNSNYIKVLDIRQESEKKIVFYREQINAKVNKKSLIHSDQTVNKRLSEVQDRFKDYQLALYLLGFASFLEIMLLENYDSDYLRGISKKLEDYSLKYRELYTKCYNEIVGYSDTSVETTVLKGVAKASTSLGKLVEKIPIISNTQTDETLIATGDKLDELNKEKIRKRMSNLIEHQSNFIKPFIENIDTVNELNNKPLQLMIDKDNLYIATMV